MATEKVDCNFVGSFKVGDNLVYNSNLLCSLVEANADGAFNKPIVLQVGSILEACLSEIIFRAQNFNLEGVPNISEADRREIEGKKADKFSVIVDVLKKYRVLDSLRLEVYDDLHRLRKYRNKIHIQDNVSIQDTPRDEADLFDDRLCSWALGLNAEVIRFMSQHLGRPPGATGFVAALSVPL